MLSLAQTGVVGMRLNGKDYMFLKDALGSITEIIDENGGLYAQYVYDAWGNTIYKSTGGLTDINPFRYRGYYMDTETGWYYLQTRYYDPVVRRFINADNYELIPYLASNIGELNLYSYCNNNPVMYTDETGEALLTLLIVGFLVGAFAQIINTAITTELNNGTHNWREYLVNGLVGGVTGMLSAINPLAGLVGGFTSGFVGDVTKQLWIENKSWTEVNFGKAAVLGAVNGVFGLISGGLLQPWGAALTSDVVAGLAIGTIVFGTAWGMSQMPFDYLVSKTFA